MILRCFIYYCGKFQTNTINQTVFGKRICKTSLGKMKTISSHLNFCPSLTTSINLYATSTFFMLDNVYQRTIYALASVTINIVQYLRNRHTFAKLTVTQIESNVRNFLRNKLLEISSFFTKIDHS